MDTVRVELLFSWPLSDLSSSYRNRDGCSHSGATVLMATVWTLFILQKSWWIQSWWSYCSHGHCLISLHLTEIMMDTVRVELLFSWPLSDLSSSYRNCDGCSHSWATVLMATVWSLFILQKSWRLEGDHLTEIMMDTVIVELLFSWPLSDLSSSYRNRDGCSQSWATVLMATVWTLFILQKLWWTES